MTQVEVRGYDGALLAKIGQDIADRLAVKGLIDKIVSGTGALKYYRAKAEASKRLAWVLSKNSSPSRTFGRTGHKDSNRGFFHIESRCEAFRDVAESLPIAERPARSANVETNNIKISNENDGLASLDSARCARLI